MSRRKRLFVGKPGAGEGGADGEVGAGIKTERKAKRKTVCCLGLISKQSCDLYSSQNCPKQVLRQLVEE